MVRATAVARSLALAPILLLVLSVAPVKAQPLCEGCLFSYDNNGHPTWSWCVPFADETWLQNCQAIPSIPACSGTSCPFGFAPMIERLTAVDGGVFALRELFSEYPEAGRLIAGERAVMVRDCRERTGFRLVPIASVARKPIDRRSVDALLARASP